MQPKYTNKPIKYNSADFRNRFALGLCADPVMYHLGMENTDDFDHEDTMILVYQVDSTEQLTYENCGLSWLNPDFNINPNLDHRNDPNPFNFTLFFPNAIDTDVKIDWGDGTFAHIKGYEKNGVFRNHHFYKNPGTYVIRMMGTRGYEAWFTGQFSNMPFADSGIFADVLGEVGYYSHYRYYLTEVKQWGNLHLGDKYYQSFFMKNVSSTYQFHLSDILFYRYSNKYVKIPDTPLTGFENVTNFGDLMREFPIKEIPKYFLKNCKKAEMIDAMFGNCFLLEYVGDYAFANLENLKSAYGVLGYSYSMQNFEVGKNPRLKLMVLGNCVFENDIMLQSSNIFYDDICEIGDYCFRNCKAVTSYFDDDTYTLKKIGKGMFEGCENLREVYMYLYWSNYDHISIYYKYYGENAVGLEEIGEDIFKGCRKLEVVRFFGQFRLSHLPERMFWECFLLRDFSHVFELEIQNYDKNGSNYFPDTYKILSLELPKEIIDFDNVQASWNDSLFFHNMFHRVLTTENTTFPLTSGEAIPFWKLGGEKDNVYGDKCYKGQFGLTNYSSIPNDWK